MAQNTHTLADDECVVLCPLNYEEEEEEENVSISLALQLNNMPFAG